MNCFLFAAEFVCGAKQIGIRVFSWNRVQKISKAIPHNSKCQYGERGAAAAKPKAQIILDAAKVSAASGGNSEPKQGQRSQSARGFCPRSTMRVPQPDIIEHFGNADAVPQPPERCLSRKAGIVRCCPNISFIKKTNSVAPSLYSSFFFPLLFPFLIYKHLFICFPVLRQQFCRLRYLLLYL